MDSSPLRAWRMNQNLSLDDVCDLIAARGIDRPSIAKLSRIERDQPVPTELIPALEAITGLNPAILRPDLAQIFDGAA